MKFIHPHPPTLTPVHTDVAHSRTGPLRCSFCTRADVEVQQLWSGAHAQVCDDCIRYMAELLAEEAVGEQMLDATDDA